MLTCTQSPTGMLWPQEETQGSVEEKLEDA